METHALLDFCANTDLRLPHNQYPDSQSKKKKYVRKVGYQANSLEFGGKTNIAHS